MTEEIKDETYFRLKEEYLSELKRLEQERDELKKTVENQKLEYEELQCDYNELEQRHNDAFEQFKEMQARHDELLASCEQSEQEAAEIIDELKQENKELGRKAFLAEQNVRTTAATFCEKDNKIKELKQENKEMKEDLKAQQMTNLKQQEIALDYWNALGEIKAIINQPCDNCKYNKDGVTCSIGDCGEGKLKIIETKINEVLND